MTYKMSTDKRAVENGYPTSSWGGHPSSVGGRATSTNNTFAGPTLVGTPNFNARGMTRRASQPETKPVERPENVENEFAAMGRQAVRKKGVEW
jgi:hypothetical protein